MVCQNQNLAESEAPLAVDMKEKIREMLEDGKTEKEIKDFCNKNNCENYNFIMSNTTGPDMPPGKYIVAENWLKTMD